MHSAAETFLHHFIPSKHNAYRPHILRRPWLLFFLTVALAIEGFLVANLLVRQSSEVFLAAVVPGEIIALTNTQREYNHVGLLSYDTLLARAAQEKAEDMAQKGYFAHVGPGGVEPWYWLIKSGYEYQYAGENLAVRFVDSSDVVDAWMESPSHRTNMVKPAYSNIGVGVANGMYQGQPATYVVQYFASPRSAQSASVHAASAWRTFMDGLERQLFRIFSDPQQTTTWALGSIALIITVGVLLTFFVHMHIQPTDMLVTGGVVALFVVGLIATNTHFLRMQTSITDTASVADAVPRGAVWKTEIPQEAASTLR